MGAYAREKPDFQAKMRAKSDHHELRHNTQEESMAQHGRTKKAWLPAYPIAPRPIFLQDQEEMKSKLLGEMYYPVVHSFQCQYGLVTPPQNLHHLMNIILGRLVTAHQLGVSESSPLPQGLK